MFFKADWPNCRIYLYSFVNAHIFLLIDTLCVLYYENNLYPLKTNIVFKVEVINTLSNQLEDSLWEL